MFLDFQKLKSKSENYETLFKTLLFCTFKKLVKTK